MSGTEVRGGSRGTWFRSLRLEGERRWLGSSTLGRERLREWAKLLLKTVEGENEELGELRWVISGLQEPATTSTVLAQLVTVSELNDVGDVLGTDTLRAGLLDRHGTGRIFISIALRRFQWTS